MAEANLEARVMALETRLTKLEASLSAPRAQNLPPARICPLCGSGMKVTRELPHQHFDFAGLKVHQMECSCGHKTERNFNPAKGYE
jgi:hypothetical protein